MFENPGMTLVGKCSGQLICMAKTRAHFSHNSNSKDLVSIGEIKTVELPKGKKKCMMYNSL